MLAIEDGARVRKTREQRDQHLVDGLDRHQEDQHEQQVHRSAITVNEALQELGSAAHRADDQRGCRSDDDGDQNERAQDTTVLAAFVVDGDESHHGATEAEGRKPSTEGDDRQSVGKGTEVLGGQVAHDEQLRREVDHTREKPSCQQEARAT